MDSLHAPTLRHLRAGALAVVVVALLLCAAPARGELVAVDQMASGMECPECSRGLRMAVRVLDGVEALETSWNRRRLTARFRAGSRATLEEIRTIIRARHFVPKDALVTVRGTLAASTRVPPRRGQEQEQEQEQEVRVSGSGVSYQLRSGSAQVAAALENASGRAVMIRGRVPGPVTGASIEDPLLIVVDGVELDEPAQSAEPAARR